jgi:hypothetical protein
MPVIAKWLEMGKPVFTCHKNQQIIEVLEQKRKMLDLMTTESEQCM